MDRGKKKGTIQIRQVVLLGHGLGELREIDRDRGGHFHQHQGADKGDQAELSLEKDGKESQTDKVKEDHSAVYAAAGEKAQGKEHKAHAEHHNDLADLRVLRLPDGKVLNDDQKDKQKSDGYDGPDGLSLDRGERQGDRRDKQGEIQDDMENAILKGVLDEPRSEQEIFDFIYKFMHGSRSPLSKEVTRRAFSVYMIR